MVFVYFDLLRSAASTWATSRPPLRLDQRHRDGLGLQVHAHPQRVVHAAFRALARLAAENLDGSGGLLAPDQIFGLAARVDCRIDELGARIRLVQEFIGSKMGASEGI